MEKFFRLLCYCSMVGIIASYTQLLSIQINKYLFYDSFKDDSILVYREFHTY